MADYPAFGQVLGSAEETFDDLVIDRAVDGTGYARSFFVAEKARFVLRHILNASQQATLRAFYTANRRIPFNVAFEGDDATYANMLFEARPRFEHIGNGLARVEVRVAQL